MGVNMFHNLVHLSLKNVQSAGVNIDSNAHFRSYIDYNAYFRLYGVHKLI